MRNGRRMKRDTAGVLNADHQGDLDAFQAMYTEPSAFNSTTCTALNPEGDIGPFYVPGEYIRGNLSPADDCSVWGVCVMADIQLINVDTCEPLADAWADVWSCNATGVYSGIQSGVNGDPSDAGNLNNTALRGVQKSDADGVVHFTFTFPGHYPGRTNHQHIIVRENATVLPNGTLAGGSASHIGQLFFDQTLIDEVEARSPYTENAAPATPNSEDWVLGEQETAGTDSDPVYSYVLLGNDTSLEIFAWIVIGVDPSASYTPTYSFALTEGGGVAVGNGGGVLSSNTGGAPPLS